MGNLNTNQLVDAVDLQDRPIGVVNRADLPRNRANFRTAHVFVFDRQGRLLLQEVAQGQRSAGLFGSSAAGYVNVGETYLSAAQRKALGELGVAPQLVAVGKTSMPDLGGTKFITLFRASHDGPFRVDSRQVTAVHFRTLSSIDLELRSWPEKFTETFRHLFAFHRAARSP